MSCDEIILRELRRISKILVLTNAQTIEEELSKIATTGDRKRMWILIDGHRMPKEIANEVGVTPMAVSYFLNAAVATELVEYSRGKPPRKVLDYVPPSWLNLIELPEVEEQSNVQESLQETTKQRNCGE